MNSADLANARVQQAGVAVRAAIAALGAALYDLNVAERRIAPFPAYIDAAERLDGAIESAQVAALMALQSRVATSEAIASRFDGELIRAEGSAM